MYQTYKMLHKTIKLAIASSIQLIKCFYIQFIEHPKIFAINSSAKYLFDFLV
jgi:hypothetical protein